MCVDLLMQGMTAFLSFPKNVNLRNKQDKIGNYERTELD